MSINSEIKELLQGIGSGAYKLDPYEHCRSCLDEAIAIRDKVIALLDTPAAEQPVGSAEVDALCRELDAADSIGKAHTVAIKAIRNWQAAMSPVRESRKSPVTKAWLEAVISDETYVEQGEISGTWKAAEEIFKRIEGDK